MRDSFRVLAGATFGLLSSFLYADVTPAAIFSDSMVLQRDTKVPVWGTASSGEKVTVRFGGQTKSGTADAEGFWQVMLDPLQSSAEPRELTVSSGKNTVIVKDVLVGVVWLASGQSNMAVPMLEALNPQEEIRNASSPQIREYFVKPDWDLTPQNQPPSGSRWKRVTPENAGKLSAIGYFFARELQRELKVPVGILNASFNGSPAEAWIPLDELQKHEHKKLLKQLQRYDNRTKAELEQESLALNEAMRLKDPGNAGVGANWHIPRTNVTKWKDCTLPATVQKDHGEYNGAFWYRKTVDLPSDWANTELTLELGAIDDLDITYFNGVKVGETGLETRNPWEFKRVYKIPGELVKAGENLIAVRVFDERHAGGIMDPELRLGKQGAVPINLAGPWKTRAEHLLTPMPFTGRLYELVKLYRVPTLLFNAMIHPVVPYGIDGVIWYQGESNADRAKEYETLFPELIEAWRTRWHMPQLPFYFVQLAGYRDKPKGPDVRSQWAELRNAQFKALSLPGTGMVTAIDIGDSKRIHPLNKQEVGRRLSLVALSKRYGRSNLVYSGPVLRSAERKGHEIRLHFDSAAGLHSTLEPIPGVTVAGANGKFGWAQAKLDGESVLISSREVPEIQMIRYGWSDHPDVTLFNSANLPMIPFELRVD